jgi:hypothetical protein
MNEGSKVMELSREKNHDVAQAVSDEELHMAYRSLPQEVNNEVYVAFSTLCAEKAEEYGLTPEEMSSVLDKIRDFYDPQR